MLTSATLSEAGATTQTGVPTPNASKAMVGLVGYDTMTGSGSDAVYSRSDDFDPTQDMYYAIRIDDGESVRWVGTTQKISPLYADDSLDFVTGLCTRGHGTVTGNQLTWAIATYNNNTLYWADVDGMKPRTDGVYSDQYASTASALNIMGNYKCRGHNQDPHIYVRNDDARGLLDSFVSLVANATFFYPLENPTTSAVSLSSDLSNLYGSLTMGGDGQITVRYARDIADALSEIRSAIAALI